MSSHGCKFQSLRENFDSTTAAGEMIMFTLANFAQFERRQTAERISASFLARAKRGLYNGGSVPLGFRIDPETPGRLEVICDEAEIVRLCFKTFLEKGTLAQTAIGLNDLKIQLKKNVEGGGNLRCGNFQIDTVYRILTNKAYLGVRVFQERGTEHEVKAAWDSVVDETVFNRFRRTKRLK